MNGHRLVLIEMENTINLQYRVGGAVRTDLILHDHINCFLQRNLNHFHTFVGIKLLIRNLFTIPSHEQPHVVGKFACTFPRCSEPCPLGGSVLVFSSSPVSRQDSGIG